MNKLIEFFNEKYGDKYGKIPYPRTTMQIYRVYQSIKSYGIKDEELVKLLHNIKLPKPKSIEEKELYTDCLYNKDDSEIGIDTSNLISKENPVFTGSISLGRKEGSTIGGYSAAIGYDTEASGYTSHAEGQSTTASEYCSHAEGCQTIASGIKSHAEGDSTKASNSFSHAEGNHTKANGESSHAEGFYTEASGDSSHAEGSNTTALSDCQHVQGRYNIEDTEGKYAHIVGNGNNNNKRSNAHTLDWDGNAWFAGQVEGTNLPYHISSKVLATIPANNIKSNNEITVNNSSINKDKRYYIEFLGVKKLCSLSLDDVDGDAIICSINNYRIEAYNDSTNIQIAISKINDNINDSTFTDLVIYEEENKYLDSKYLESDLILHNSISLGRVGDLGVGSSAMGYAVEASGDSSHAEGNGTKASGFASHAEGYTSTTSGQGSHAEGWSTTASGDCSHAEGHGTIAQGQNQHVQGKFNIEDNTNEYAHIVGNGSGDDFKSNAHTLDWDGNAWFAGKLSQEGIPTEDKDLVTKKYVDDSRDNLVSNIYGNNIYNFQITEDEFNSLCNLLYNDRNNKIALNSISSDTLNTIINGHIWYNAISFNKKIILKVKSTGSGGLVVYTKGESTDGHVNYMLLSLKSNESNIVTISYTSFIEYNYNDNITNLGILNNKVNIQKGTKNQYINATEDFELVLPNVTEYIEIHLYLTPSSTVSITFPPSIKWKDVPTIEANKVYEIIFKYINETIGWIGEYKIYN